MVIKNTFKKFTKRETKSNRSILIHQTEEENKKKQKQNQSRLKEYTPCSISTALLSQDHEVLPEKFSQKQEIRVIWKSHNRIEVEGQLLKVQDK